MPFTVISITYSQHLSIESWKTSHAGANKWCTLLFKLCQLKAFILIGFSFCMSDFNVQKEKYEKSWLLSHISLKSLLCCHYHCDLRPPLDSDSSMWHVLYDAHLPKPKALELQSEAQLHRASQWLERARSTHDASDSVVFEDACCRGWQSQQQQQNKQQEIKAPMFCSTILYSFHGNVYFHLTTVFLKLGYTNNCTLHFNISVLSSDQNNS